ncbi:hypothetical protein HK096_002126 [Nowakowskiella sp. JEL0078]|nr:hypothetical protein HK096_002126 [Nowakowskiella sp. JEL0078]
MSYTSDIHVPVSPIHSALYNIHSFLGIHPASGFSSSSKIIEIDLASSADDLFSSADSLLASAAITSMDNDLYLVSLASTNFDFHNIVFSTLFSDSVSPTSSNHNL